MPPQGHKTITVNHETWQLIEEIRRTFPLQVTQGEVVRGALLVLFNQEDPLNAIMQAKQKAEGSAKGER